MKFTISPAQSQFIQSKKKVVIFQGGIRSGKTRGLVYRAILSAMLRRTFLLVSFSYPMLRDVILPILKAILAKMNEEDGRITFKINETSMTVTVTKGGIGTNILLRSGDSPDSLRGISCADAGIDEAREFPTRYIYDILIGRMSDVADGHMYIATSPKGKNWVNELALNNSDCELIHQSTRDNQFLSSEYLEMLVKNYNSKYAQQEIDGEIVELGAGIIDPDWFKIIDYFKPVRAVRAWDVAVSTKTAADYSVGLLATMIEDYTIIHNVVRVKVTYPELRRKIIETAKQDGLQTTIVLEKAGQQQAFIDDLIRGKELGHFAIRPYAPDKDKFSRAMPWTSRAEQGLVKVCRGGWNKNFFDELAAFSQNAKDYQHDDQVDALSMAYSWLVNNSGPLIWTTAQEAERFEKEQSVKAAVEHQNPIDGFKDRPASSWMPGAGPGGFFG